MRRSKCSMLIDLFRQKLKLVQDAGFGGAELGELGVTENLKQSDLKGWHGGDAVHGEAVLIPLAGDARIAVEEGDDEVGLVAVRVVLDCLRA